MKTKQIFLNKSEHFWKSRVLSLYQLNLLFQIFISQIQCQLLPFTKQVAHVPVSDTIMIRLNALSSHLYHLYISIRFCRFPQSIMFCRRNVFSELQQHLQNLTKNPIHEPELFTPFCSSLFKDYIFDIPSKWTTLKVGVDRHAIQNIKGVSGLVQTAAEVRVAHINNLTICVHNSAILNKPPGYLRSPGLHKPRKCWCRCTELEAFFKLLKLYYIKVYVCLTMHEWTTLYTNFLPEVCLNRILIY